VLLTLTVNTDTFLILCLIVNEVVLWNWKTADTDVIGEKPIQASCQYCNESGRHFRIYLLEKWTDLNKTWQRVGEWATSDSVKILARSLQKPQRKDQNTIFLRDEYDAPVWSLPLYRFPRNLAKIRDSVSA